MRRWGLYVLLAMTVGLSVRVGQGPLAGQDVAEAIVRERAVDQLPPDSMRTPVIEPVVPLVATVPVRSSLAWVPETRAFAVARWEPASVVPTMPRVEAAPVKPPPPAAPPLPFTYIGKLDLDGGRQVYYVVNGDTRYALQAGGDADGVFADVYRFEGVQNGHLVIRYQPLEIKQYLPMNP
jgi:hypothetical protein